MPTAPAGVQRAELGGLTAGQGVHAVGKAGWRLAGSPLKDAELYGTPFRAAPRAYPKNKLERSPRLGRWHALHVEWHVLLVTEFRSQANMKP